MFSLMKKMDMRSKLMVPLDNWALARNYAGQLQRDFGVKFSVKRMTTSRTKLNFVLIERVE